ncbi:sensor histidine kinase [Nonomuraea sp. NPDC050556]|uniref:sensor histidine kinase n=1 Tax=Nonomuraea sp. NPDC050556 TaxID=3364369 RepID=UPI0037994E05
MRSVPPVLLDALLAAGLFVVTLGPGLAGTAEPYAIVLQAGLLAPLVWRRRAPVVVFALVAAVAFVQWLLGVQLPADMALLVALYTLAAHRAWPYTLAAGVVTTAGIGLATLSWAPPGRLLASAVALAAMAAAAVLLGLHMRARQEHARELEQRAVDEERARIAREMHDIVTHNLSVMVALADAATAAQECAPVEAAAAMRQVSGTGRQALADMRRSLGGEASRHPMPGIAELDALADHMRATGLPTSLDVEGVPATVPAAAQLTVYRLVQEALTNTLKHAPKGTKAQVQVRLAPGSATVEVTDDGPSTAPPTWGRGLVGMRERAAAYGGVLEAGPRARGWRIFARLELPR